MPRRRNYSVYFACSSLQLLRTPAPRAASKAFARASRLLRRRAGTCEEMTWLMPSFASSTGRDWMEMTWLMPRFALRAIRLFRRRACACEASSPRHQEDIGALHPPGCHRGAAPSRVTSVCKSSRSSRI